MTGNIRGIYDGIKTAMGPVQNKTVPLESTTGEVITDKGQRWRDGWNTILTSTPDRMLWWLQPSMPSSACLSWKRSTLNHPQRNLIRPSTAWPQGKPQAEMGSPPLTWSSTVRLPYCFLCMKSSSSAGKKRLLHKTWGMPRSSFSRKIKATVATVTTTEASRYSA